MPQSVQHVNYILLHLDVTLHVTTYLINSSIGGFRPLDNIFLNHQINGQITNQIVTSLIEYLLAFAQYQSSELFLLFLVVNTNLAPKNDISLTN